MTTFIKTMKMTITETMAGGGEPCQTLHDLIAEPVGSEKMTRTRKTMKTTTMTMTRRGKNRMVRKRRGKRWGRGGIILGEAVRRRIRIIRRRGIGMIRRRIRGRRGRI